MNNLVIHIKLKIFILNFKASSKFNNLPVFDNKNEKHDKKLRKTKL